MRRALGIALTDAIREARKDFARDAGADEVEVYRRLVSDASADGDADLGLSDASRLGAAVNNQSVLLGFEVNGHRILLTGDMQLALPGMAGLERDMAALRERIQADAPFAFVKLPHHGSDNAFDETLLAEWDDTPLYAISGGTDDPTHPDPLVLELLKANRSRLRWARTDHNGLISLRLSGDVPTMEKSRGRFNDAVPNPPGDASEDEPSEPAPTTPSVVAEPVVARAATRSSDFVEVTAKVPHVKTRVRLTIDVEPAAAPEDVPRRPERRAQATPRPRPRPPRTAMAPLPLSPPPSEVGAGAKLLLVTTRSGLSANIGRVEASQLLDALGRGNQTLLDLDQDAPRPSAAGDVVVAVQRALVAGPRGGGGSFDGVVLVGGPDIVPMLRLDTLSPDLRPTFGGRVLDREDDFFVWSDDLYGDLDDDGFPRWRSPACLTAERPARLPRR